MRNIIFHLISGPGTKAKLLKAMRDALVIGILSFMVTQIVHETGHSGGKGMPCQPVHSKTAASQKNCNK